MLMHQGLRRVPRLGLDCRNLWRSQPRMVEGARVVTESQGLKAQTPKRTALIRRMQIAG